MTTRLHLVDGTFELFRSYFGAPKATAPDGREVGATRGILRTLAALVRRDDVTHVAAAFDTVIESFRNEMFPGYKSSAGVDQELLDQFPLGERASHALGIATWGMVDFEADDAIATAVSRFAADVDQVVIGSPDKDLAQCIRGETVVAFNTIQRKMTDEDGVMERFGVPPASIPDWLGLVGDAADGLPGVPRWGAKSTTAVLARYGHIEDIPLDASGWDLAVRGAAGLADNLREHIGEALLYRDLATLRTDVPLAESLDDLEWRGARRDELEELCAEIGDDEVMGMVERWRDA